MTFESAEPEPELEPVLEEFLAVIEDLKPHEREDWNRCMVKCFDCGFEASPDRAYTSYAIPHRLVERIGDLGASLALTVYRPSDLS